MASVTMLRTSVCSGGGHHVIKVTAGAQEVSRTITVDDLGSLSAADLDLYIVLTARVFKQVDSKTNGQLLTAFVNGVTITIA